MDEKKEERELLAQRISTILTRLNVGETLNIEDLEREFKVSKRTLQRDFNTRLAYLPLTRNEKSISLDPIHLGKLGMKDIHNFAVMAGVQELFPSLDSAFVTALLGKAFNSPFLVKGYHYEDKQETRLLMNKLMRAIEQRKRIEFSYNGKDYPGIDPYKLVNNKGVWYLAATDRTKLKSFHMLKIRNLVELNEGFEVDAGVVRLIAEEDSIWFSEDKIEVVLKVSAEVAYYFQRRKLLPNQQIDKELETGELIVSSRVAHENQIVPLIKYWIPHVRVISPPRVEGAVLRDLRGYMGESISN